MRDDVIELSYSRGIVIYFSVSEESDRTQVPVVRLTSKYYLQVLLLLAERRVSLCICLVRSRVPVEAGPELIFIRNSSLRKMFL